jgi:hypothetical protein
MGYRAPGPGNDCGPKRCRGPRRLSLARQRALCRRLSKPLLLLTPPIAEGMVQYNRLSVMLRAQGPINGSFCEEACLDSGLALLVFVSPA